MTIIDKQIQGKKLLLLGGVRAACEIIREAQKVGVIVYETDYLPDSPAKKVADKAFMTSCTDVDAVVELCKAEGIDGLFTGYTDSLLPFAEQICRKLNFPFWGDSQNIEMCINKQMFKEACEKSNVPVVPWKRVNGVNYKEAIKSIELPVVFKPVDNSGSRGVFKCYKKEDLLPLCEQSLSYSKSKELLVERLMDAHNEFSAYYIMNQGDYYFTGMGDRYIFELAPDIAPVGHGMLFPSIYTSQWIKQMDAVIKQFFAENRMKDGFVFVQGFYEDGHFFIHEIGYRLNGGFSFKLVEHLCNYNQIHQLVKYSLTGKMDKEEIAKSDPYLNGKIGMILTATLGKGTIKKIGGVEKAASLPGVIQFYQLKEVGTTLTSNGTTAQVFAYILITADTAEDLKKLIIDIEGLITVEDESGNNLLLPMINPEELRFIENKKNERFKN